MNDASSRPQYETCTMRCLECKREQHDLRFCVLNGHEPRSVYRLVSDLRGGGDDGGGGDVSSCQNDSASTVGLRGDGGQNTEGVIKEEGELHAEKPNHTTANNRAWSAYLKKLSVFKKRTHGRMNVQISEDRSLHFWVAAQKTRYNHGQLLIERQTLLERLGLIFVSPRFNSAQLEILRERFALKQTRNTAEYENIAKEITCLNGGKAVQKRVVQNWFLRNASMIRRNKSNKARGSNKFLLRRDPASSGDQEKAGSQKEQIKTLSSKDNKDFCSDGDVDKTGGDFAGSDDACNGSEVHSSKKKPSVNEDDFEEQEEEVGEEKEEEDDDEEEEDQEKEEGQEHRADSAVVDKRPRIEQKSVKERQDVASARLSQAAKLDLLSKKAGKEKADSDKGRDEGGANSSNLFKRGDAVIAQ